MTARPIWSGVVSFGLVTVPVSLFTATEDRTSHFHQLQRGTSDRVRNQRVNERTSKEVGRAGSGTRPRLVRGRRSRPDQAPARRSGAQTGTAGAHRRRRSALPDQPVGVGPL